MARENAAAHAIAPPILVQWNIYIRLADAQEHMFRQYSICAADRIHILQPIAWKRTKEYIVKNIAIYLYRMETVDIN